MERNENVRLPPFLNFIKRPCGYDVKRNMFR